MTTKQWILTLGLLLQSLWFFPSCVVGGEHGDLPDGWYKHTDGSTHSNLSPENNTSQTGSDTFTESADPEHGNQTDTEDNNHTSPDMEISEQSAGKEQMAESLRESSTADVGMEQTPEKKPTDDTVSCGKVGMEVDAKTPCCTNLKRAAWAEPPGCRVVENRWICVDCGDNVCDSKAGENSCNCVVDCVSNPECRQDSDCGKPSCRDSGTSCVLSTPTCRNGRCVVQSQTQSVMRCVSGSRCEKRCLQNSDCGSPSCSNSGTSCEQTTPTCTSGVCQTNTQTQSQMQCNTSTNTCEIKPCRVVADCGTPECKQNGTTCEGHTWYCLAQRCRSLPVSQQNRICNTTSGVCEAPKSCKTVADCGKSSCQQNNNFCTQTVVSCTSSVCQTQIRDLAYSTCQTTTGFCQTKQCTQTSDCGKHFCEDVGTDCKEVVPGCAYNIVCQSAIRTVKNAKCQAATGKCILQKPCQQNSDCGEPLCLLDKQTCTNIDATCLMGTCQVQNKAATGFCNVTTGRCQ